MSKITEAQAILAALRLPAAQQSEIAALTLLALAQLDEDTAWSDARRQSLRIHDMMQSRAIALDAVMLRIHVKPFADR
jgi:hypothetical protein